MQAGAYLLINVQSGEEVRILEELRDDPTVKQVHIVTGLHDLVCYIEAGSFEKLRDEIIDSIRQLDGITKTVTCITFDENYK